MLIRIKESRLQWSSRQVRGWRLFTSPAVLDEVSCIVMPLGERSYLDDYQFVPATRPNAIGALGTRRPGPIASRLLEYLREAEISAYMARR